MQFDWWTLALQTVNFLILVWLLQRFLYRPVREILEKRKALSEQVFADAQKKVDDAEAVRKQLEQDRAQFVEERQDVLRKVHEELGAERDKLLEAAQSEAEQLIHAAKDAINSERDSALDTIRQDAAVLAADMASTLLQKTGTGAPNDIFLEQIERHLKSLPFDERKRLDKDLVADDARVTVLTAAPLATADRDRWRKRLGEFFGNSEKLVFESDPKILGGVELKFPHAVLNFTWADQLRQAKELIGQNDDAA